MTLNRIDSRFVEDNSTGNTVKQDFDSVNAELAQNTSDITTVKKKASWRSAEEFTSLNEAFNSIGDYSTLFLEPNKEYLVTSTVVPPKGVTIICNNAKIKADVNGTFTSILEGGSNTDTGFKVLYDLRKATQSRLVGKLTINGNDVANLVGMASSVLTDDVDRPAFNSLYDHIQFNRCARGIYTQKTTVATAGAMTGSSINHMEFFNCIEDFVILGSNDDIVFSTVRSRGKIQINNNTGLKIESLWLYGGDATNSTDGVVLGSNVNVVIDHLFVEGDFRYPILMNGADAKLTINDLLVSPNFSAKAGEIVYIAQPTGQIIIHANPANTQSTPLQSLVHLYIGNATDSRSVIIYSSYPNSEKAFVSASGSTTKPKDHVIIYTTEGELRAYISSLGLRYHYIDVNFGYTGDRPTENVVIGSQFFDRTIGKPIWWTGSDWVDSTGTTV
ncbi:hypothetical protein [Paraliobacillus ryukyuensis]|uniref:hypothetical protein n=1 Tax=Paraliobacillus ryukyuensis TaxID=200904 RepID=UPI0009A8D8E9|nr:hypothetical protein [Paraliobacillus ryukyuensis]